MASSNGLPFPERERAVSGLLLATLLTACAPRVAALPLAELALQPTRGEPVSVTQLLSRADATVFVFWSAGCPCVRRYQARVDALAAEWSSRGVAVIEVSSNAGESLESLREAERLRSLVRPLWRDEGGLLARQLDARSTPTVVLLRRDGQVLYRGWLDNERQPGEAGREPWLELALQRFVAPGGRPALAKSPTWGCTITRSLTPSVAPQCHVPSPEVASSGADSPGGSP
ncbi:MAG: redoxin domain-containing protein [Archangium sp.]|nr:redoxin domain-containing protein [Archangium sp.]